MGFHIHIVDDHRLFRQGLKILVENIPGITKITETNNGQEFISFLQTEQPDLILIDIEMPVLNGVEATKAAIRLFPDLKVIALSMFGDEEYYQQMIDAGARGFLLKNTDFSEVKNGIFAVLEGGNCFSEEILYKIIQNKTPRVEISDDILSDREKDILFEICLGLSNHEIAEKLSISKRTVDKHRSNILFKTNSKNTASLVMYAIKHNLIEP